MFESFISAVFWGVLVLSVLVFVHEGGHFVAARFFGMRVTEFFLGLPFRWHLSRKSKRFGTEFGVTPLLLGGYNRICGMEGTLDDQCAAVLAIVQREGRAEVARVATELGLDEGRAYEIMATLVDLAAIRPYYDPALDEKPWQREWPAAFETLERDADLLTEYDADHDFSAAGCTVAGVPHPVDDADAFLAHEVARTYAGKGAFARIVTLLAGPFVNILLAFVLVVGSLTLVGVEMYTNTSEIDSVVAGSYAESAGLKGGDRIIRFDNKDVSTWDELVAAIDGALEHRGSIPIAYERAGETFETKIDLPEDGTIDLFGVNAAKSVYHLGFSEAVAYTFSYIKLVAGTIVRLIMPTHTIEVVSQSSSIVGISTMASEAAASGPNDLVLFAAAISLSLGFMNLLPLPPLDGGKIVVELIQLGLRRPLSPKVQAALSYVGLAFVLFIFCFALRNDIVRILGGM